MSTPELFRLIPPCSPLSVPLLRLWERSRVLRSSIYAALDGCHVLSYHTIRGSRDGAKQGARGTPERPQGRPPPGALPAQRGAADTADEPSEPPTPDGYKKPHSTSGALQKIYGDLIFRVIYAIIALLIDVSQRNFLSGGASLVGGSAALLLHQIIIWRTFFILLTV